jgi:hypothetical protein
VKETTMRRIWTMGLAAALAAVLGGCASSEHELRKAQVHQQQAKAYAAAGYYKQAGKEQKKANKDLKRAASAARYNEPIPTVEPLYPPVESPSNPTLPPY